MPTIDALRHQPQFDLDDALYEPIVLRNIEAREISVSELAEAL